MAVATSLVIAGIGLALSAVGTGVAVYGAVQQQAGMKKQEELRAKQMNLDLLRRRRAAVRQMLAQRSQGINNATSQGASITDSSVQGGIAQTVGIANQSSLALDQNAEIGYGMGAANSQINAGSGVSSMGASIQGWGSGLVQNSDTISRVGSSFGLWGKTVGGAV